MDNVPGIAFLGLCDRASEYVGADPGTRKFNLLGLSNIRHSHVFPANLNGVQLVFAIYNPPGLQGFRISLRNSYAQEILVLNADMKNSELIDDVEGAVRFLQPRDRTSWSILITEVNVSHVIEEPGEYRFVLHSGGHDMEIGRFWMAYLAAPPLTPELIEAIRSNPNASKFVRIQSTCKHCGDQFRVYTALDRSATLESDGWIWYRDIPGRYICSCGRVNHNLTMIRESMHGLLRVNVDNSNDELSFARLYEKSTIEDIVTGFASLLNMAPREEAVQQYIEENPILLHQFTPRKIFAKASILTKYKTDFAILTQAGELLLIEIEKPSKKLLGQKGGISSELQHALDQVTDWLKLVEEHRAAANECIGLDPKEVVKVRGVAIVGRDEPYQEMHLRKLKWRDFGPITFLSYDDLLRGAATLSRTVAEAGTSVNTLVQGRPHP